MALNKKLRIKFQRAFILQRAINLNISRFGVLDLSVVDPAINKNISHSLWDNEGLLRVEKNGVYDLKFLNVNSEFVFEQRFFLLAKKLKIFSRDQAFILQNVPFHCEFFCNDFSLVFHVFNERRSDSVDKTA